MRETGMRIGLVAAGLVLVGGMATACGDDADNAPDSASKEDFCKAMESAPDEGKPSQDDVDKWAEELKEAGTPKDISDDQRHGYEVLIDALDDADVDDFDDNTSFEDVVEDKDDREDVTKFFGYWFKTCNDEIPTELPTDVPTELPTDLTELPTDLTELPTEFPTSLPTEFPTDMTLPTEIPS
jgi:hypothetical protein